MTSIFFLISVAAFFYVMACFWRDLKGNDDSHGFTLKNYIEYLAKEI